METSDNKVAIEVKDEGCCGCLIGCPLLLLLLGGVILLIKLAWSFLLYAINY